MQIGKAGIVAAGALATVAVMGSAATAAPATTAGSFAKMRARAVCAGSMKNSTVASPGPMSSASARSIRSCTDGQTTFGFATWKAGYGRH